MHCQKCGTDNEDTFKFCVKCGTALGAPRDRAARGDADAGASEMIEPAGTEATVELSTSRRSLLMPKVIFRVYIDGRELDSIASGQSKGYTVESGVHSIQVRSAGVWSEPLSFNTAEGSRMFFECGHDILFGGLWVKTHTG